MKDKLLLRVCDTSHGHARPFPLLKFHASNLGHTSMVAGRNIKPSGLISKAISLVKGFNPATQTGDSYADDALAVGSGSKVARNAASSDIVFLKQVHDTGMLSTLNIMLRSTVMMAKSIRTCSRGVFFDGIIRC